MAEETRVCIRCNEAVAINLFKPKGRICQPCKKKDQAIRCAEWAKNHADYLRIYRAERRNEFPEKFTHRSARRRAAKLAAKGSFSAEDIVMLRQLQGDTCVYCGDDISKTYCGDHIFPISKYFYDGPENLQLLCKPCNSSKLDKDPYEYENKICVLTPERREKLDSILEVIKAAHAGVENYDAWRIATRMIIIDEHCYEEDEDYDTPYESEYYEPRYTYEMWGYV